MYSEYPFLQARLQEYFVDETAWKQTESFHLANQKDFHGKFIAYLYFTIMYALCYCKMLNKSVNFLSI